MRSRCSAVVLVVAVILAGVLTSVLGTRTAFGQNVGPGLGNLTYTTAELFEQVGLVKSPRGHGHVAMVGGYLMVIYSSDGGGSSGDGGIEFWDVSDPRAPKLVKRYDNWQTHFLREAHGFGRSTVDGKSYVATQGAGGVLFWDVTDPLAMSLASYLQLPGISLGDYSGVWWLFWQAPYVYVAGVGEGLFIVDATNPRKPLLKKRLRPSELGGTGPQQLYAIGNLLVLVAGKANRFTTMDISDPEDPILLQTMTGLKGYSHLFAAGKIMTCGGDGGPVQMHLHDVTHDGRMKYLGTAPPTYSNGGYGSYQDGYFHVGFSNRYAKVHAATLKTVGTGSSGLGGRDEDFGIVLGNVVWVGNDHGQGSALIAHQTQPDSRGPDVHWIHPPASASGVSVTGRVGLGMSDSVDLASVNSATFSVRPRGGAVLPGRYSVQMGIVNFSPSRPLAPNTVYEVEVNGVRDLVGNTGAAFRSTFTTGSANAGPLVTRIVTKSNRAYQIGSFQPGATLYIDRTYTYTSIHPAAFLGQPYILTSNEDKAGTGAGFLTFTLAAPARVHVLFDVSARQLPAWLTTWTNANQIVKTNDRDRNVYYKDFPAGVVPLGGNADPPQFGAGSMYTVVIVPTTSAPTCDPLALTPTSTNRVVVFQAPTVAGTPPFTYSWDFGDGTPPTTPSPHPSVAHTFTKPGRFVVLFRVTNALGTTACSAVQVAHSPLTPARPTRSSTVIHTGTACVCVNADNDTVTAIDTTTLQKRWEVRVGRHPRTVARSPLGHLWVVNQEDASISVLQPSDGKPITTISLLRGTQPYGICFSPDGLAAYVSLEAIGGVVKLTPTGSVVGAALLGGKARGVAVSHDSRRLFVTRFLSVRRDPVTTKGTDAMEQGEVWEFDARSLAGVAAHTLHYDAGPDTEKSGRGVPNYLTSITLSPDGTRALIPSKKDNTARGQYRDGQPLTFESRTRTIVSELSLIGGGENLAARVDLNDRDMAQSVAFSPRGDLFLVASQGTNVVDVYDAITRDLLAVLPTGLAPQGLAFDPGGKRLFVHNFMGRTVTVYDTDLLTAGISNSATRLADVPTVNTETLGPQVLQGKRIFYDAGDRRMNRDGYISCASCHLDGGHDGRTWDFTQAGEGLRNTISLVGRAGLGHGNVHWTANFDEVQDFENDIRGAFGGAGFMTNRDFNATMNPLGPKKTGLSADLDALAAYVTSLGTFPKSPYRNPDGTFTADGVRGEQVFQQMSCSSCHKAPTFTDRLRHDVGTITPASGLGRGLPLPGVGIETPTLRGLWDTAPYYHHGGAPALGDTLRSAAHGGADRLSPQQRKWLIAYLLQLE